MDDCPLDIEITRKNAADRPLNPTDNPSELSMKLNAFVRVTIQNKVRVRFIQISICVPVWKKNSGESNIFTCIPKYINVEAPSI
jgi:hypothetical protein